MLLNKIFNNIMNFLPSDIENIILNYKTDFENLDTFYKEIDELKNKKKSQLSGFKTNICYLDVKDYLIKNRISYFKYLISNDYDYDINEDGRVVKTRRNYGFSSFSLRTDCDYDLQICNIKEVMYSFDLQIFYFKMEI